MISKGIRTSIARSPIFCDFPGGVRPPVPPVIDITLRISQYKHHLSVKLSIVKISTYVCVLKTHSDGLFEIPTTCLLLKCYTLSTRGLIKPGHEVIKLEFNLKIQNKAQ